MYALAITVHLLSAIVWVGGMFFAWVCLRPSLGETLEPPQAARLLAASLGRFFGWVWGAVAALLVSGFGMALARYDLGAAPWWLILMIALGVTMMALFAHVFFAPYRRLRRALEAGDGDRVRGAVASIRRIVGINLGLGLLLVAVVSLGRYA